MFMLLEINRVLVDGGTLVLTTPNVASFTAVARLLECTGNPQLYSMYPNPSGEYKDTEIPHVREYTPQELAEAVKAAGFEVEYLFTRKNRRLQLRSVHTRRFGAQWILDSIARRTGLTSSPGNGRLRKSNAIRPFSTRAAEK